MLLVPEEVLFLYIFKLSIPMSSSTQPVTGILLRTVEPLIGVANVPKGEVVVPVL